MAELDPALAARVALIHGTPTARVAMPRRVVATTIEIYDFLLDQLELTGTLVEKLRLGSYRIQGLERGQIEVDDRAGAIARLSLLQRSVDGERQTTQRVYLAEGYLTLLFTKLPGDALITLSYGPCGDGAALGVAARGEIAFRAGSPLLHDWGLRMNTTLTTLLERKAGLFIAAARDVSERASADPAAMQRAAEKLEGFDGATVERFCTLLKR
jgi:hypothetical protein